MADENLLQTLGRLGVTGLERTAEIPGGIINLLSNLPTAFGGGATSQITELAKPVLDIPELLSPENVRKQAGSFLPEGYLEPKGIIEKGVVGAIPGVITSAATGGLSAIGTGANLAGSILGATAEELGLPAPVQFAADLLGSAGFNKLAKMVKSTKLPNEWKNFSIGQTARAKAERNIPLSIRERHQLQKEAQYAKASEEAPKIKISDGEINKTIDKLSKEISSTTSLSKIDKERLGEQFEFIKKNISDGEISINDLWERKKDINNTLKDISSDNARKYWYRLLDPIKDKLQDAAIKNPQFGIPFMQAEAMHQAQNYQSSLSKLMQQDGKLNRLLSSPVGIGLQSILGGTLGFAKGGLPGAIAGTASPLGTQALAKAAQKTGEVFDFIGFIKKDPTARNLLQKSIIELSKENLPAAKNSLIRLLTKANKYESKSQDQEEFIVSDSFPEEFLVSDNAPSL